MDAAGARIYARDVRRRCATTSKAWCPLIGDSFDSIASYAFVGCDDAAYPEVLALRRLAYGAVGKVPATGPLATMADEYDARSRLLVARLPAGVVGSLRLMLQNPGDRNEYDSFTELPPTFPPRHDTAVLTRVCTHPDFRGGGLLYGLLRECYREARRLRVRYLLGGSTDALLPVYERAGMRGQGVFFVHAGLNGIREQLLLGDTHEIAAGVGVDRALWDRFFRDALL